MNSIGIVVFLVRCTADLVVCATAPSEHLRYASMDACRAEVAQLVSGRNSGQDDGVWMGKCLYRLAEADSRRTRRDRAFAHNGLIRTADAAH